MKSILNKLFLAGFLASLVFLVGVVFFANNVNALTCYTNGFDGCGTSGCNGPFVNESETCTSTCPGGYIQACISSSYTCRDSSPQPCTLGYVGDVQGSCGGGDTCVVSNPSASLDGFCQKAIGALQECGVGQTCGCAPSGGTGPGYSGGSCGDGICSTTELATGSCSADCGGGGTTGPGVTISAPSTVIMPTNSVTLQWTTTGNPTSCTASSTPATSWSGSVSTYGGSQTIYNLSSITNGGKYNFNITCSNLLSAPIRALVVTPLIGLRRQELILKNGFEPVRMLTM